MVDERIYDKNPKENGHLKRGILTKGLIPVQNEEQICVGLGCF